MDGSVLAEITPGGVFEPIWLPDSRTVAFSSDVFIVDIDGGTRRLTDHNNLDAITCLVLSPAGARRGHPDNWIACRVLRRL